MIQDMDFGKFLSDSFKQNEIPVVSTSKIQYPTGFEYLDYNAGSYLTVYDEDEDPIYTYHNVGIQRGSVNVIIAKSQGGKTTLALALASAIITPYMKDFEFIRNMSMKHARGNTKVKEVPFDGQPIIQILDTEKTLPVDYVKKVSQFTNKQTKSCIMINPITTDKDVIKCLEQHVRYKTTHMQKVQMPMLDMYGNPIMEYPPTVMILDSSSQLLLEDCDDPAMIKKGKNAATISSIYDSNVQNTSGARRAKVITALYSQLVNYADRFNIIIFSINHINKMLPINGIPVKQYRGLRAGETIGGGEKAIYLANTILRLDVIKNVSSTGSTSINLGEDVSGFISVASWIKSKTNSKSNTCQLVYTDRAGYDPLLSNLYQMKTDGDLKESGRFLYVPGRDDVKFTLKNFREVYGEHPDLLVDTYRCLRDICAKRLDNPDRAAQHDKKLMDDVRKDIHDEFGKGEDVNDMDDMFAELINS